MATLPRIIFQKGQGGLSRPLPGQDHISSLLIYTANANLPSGFSTSSRIKTFYSLADAESAGILNDSSDATAATGTYLVTAAGTNGDTLNAKVTEIGPDGVVRTQDLGTYTKASTETTAIQVATAIVAVINAGTVNHGYSAANGGTATVTITAPKRLGIYLNTGTPIVVTLSAGATLAGTLTQFSGGVASRFAVWHYHISEYFRMQPQGVLWVGFYAVPGSYTFTEVTTIQNAAGGAIRQVGVLKDPAGVYATADLTALDTVCKANDAVYKPLSALYAADLSGTVDISTLADLSTLSANKASDVIAQDGGGQGNYLWLTTGKSITSLGTLLGTVSLAKVSENIGWVGQFNISDGTECEVLAFANGQKFTDSAISDSLLESLNAKRHIFLRKFVGVSGSYWNDSHTAIVVSSDYAYIEGNRTIDKAIRGLYAGLLPSLNSPIQLNSDGTLSETTTAYLESQANVSLDDMVRNGELSAKLVVINPAQNVLSTSKIIVAVTLVANGVARYITVPIGFKPKIS